MGFFLHFTSYQSLEVSTGIAKNKTGLLSGIALLFVIPLPVYIYSSFNKRLQEFLVPEG